ncbi:hypothetical protein D3C84_860100 [compost metagenome]
MSSDEGVHLTGDNFFHVELRVTRTLNGQGAVDTGTKADLRDHGVSFVVEQNTTSVDQLFHVLFTEDQRQDA